MEIKLGTLDFRPILGNLDLVAPVVAGALKLMNSADEIGTCEIDQSLSDTNAFCEHYQVAPELAANCVIIEIRDTGEKKLIATVVLATTKIDVNGVVRKVMGVKKASFASMADAVALSGMEYGAITPIGLPSDWPILIDKAVADAGYLIVGSGLRQSKISVKGSMLATLPNAQVVEGLGKLPASFATQ